MKATASTKIPTRIGDLVASTKRQKTGEIIEIDYERNTGKVFYPSESADNIEWICLQGLNFFKREYKIMNLTEMPGNTPNQKILLAELSPIQKTYVTTNSSYSYFTSFSLTDVEYFWIPLENKYAQDFIRNPEENKIINFIDFVISKMNFNGDIIDAFYSMDLARIKR